MKKKSCVPRAWRICVEFDRRRMVGLIERVAASVPKEKKKKRKKTKKKNVDTTNYRHS